MEIRQKANTIRSVVGFLMSMAVLYLWFGCVSRRDEKVYYFFPVPPRPGSGHVDEGGRARLALRSPAPGVPRIDPVGRSQQAVGHRPQLVGTEGQRQRLVVRSDHLEHGQRIGRAGEDAHRVGASGHEEGSSPVPVEGDPRVVATVGDLAVADDVVALGGADHLGGAGGGEDDVGCGGEGGAHGRIVSCPGARVKWCEWKFSD